MRACGVLLLLSLWANCRSDLPSHAGRAHAQPPSAQKLHLAVKTQTRDLRAGLPGAREGEKLAREWLDARNEEREWGAKVETPRFSRITAGVAVRDVGEESRRFLRKEVLMSTSPVSCLKDEDKGGYVAGSDRRQEANGEIQVEEEEHTRLFCLPVLRSASSSLSNCVLRIRGGYTPKKGRKSRSKRKPLALKYKIIKRVKQVPFHPFFLFMLFLPFFLLLLLLPFASASSCVFLLGASLFERKYKLMLGPSASSFSVQHHAKKRKLKNKEDRAKLSKRKKGDITEKPKCVFSHPLPFSRILFLPSSVCFVPPPRVRGSAARSWFPVCNSDKSTS
eukprot:1722625-Rhodomonas_salina.1